MHLPCPTQPAPFTVQDGCAFIHTKKKKTILLTSGPGMTRRTQWMNDAHGNIFFSKLYQQMCSSNILLRSVNEHRLNPSAGTQCTCIREIPPKVAVQAHSASIFMSYLHLHDLYATLSEKLYSPCRQTDTHDHTDMVVCELQPPPPHLSKTGQHWPLSGSLSQYALRYETGKHMRPLGAGCSHVGRPHATRVSSRIDFIHPDEEWTIDGQVLTDNGYLGHSKMERKNNRRWKKPPPPPKISTFEQMKKATEKLLTLCDNYTPSNHVCSYQSRLKSIAEDWQLKKGMKT